MTRKTGIINKSIIALMKKIDITEVKNRLSALIDSVKSGLRAQLTRRTLLASVV
jgi:hypothetical protein